MYCAAFFGDHCAVSNEPEFERALGAQAPSKRGKGLAIAALIIGIIACFLAWVPVAGVIVGAVAVFLGLLARRRNASNKSLATWGLVLGALSALASLTVAVLLVTGLTIFTTSGWSSAGPEMPTTVYESGNTPDLDAQPGVGDVGAPEPMRTLVTAAEWKVEILTYNPRGDSIVSQVNAAGQVPPSGHHFEIITYKVTKVGTDPGYALDANIDLLDESLSPISQTFVYLDDEMGDDLVSPGDSRTGTKTFIVPNGQRVILRVTPGELANESFLSTE